jgi:hypothetical protein
MKFALDAKALGNSREIGEDGFIKLHPAKAAFFISATSASVKMAIGVSSHFLLNAI